MQYKIIQLPPYDRGASVSWMIEETSKYFFNLFTRRKLIGNYKWGQEEGHKDWMPFFNKQDAQKRIKQLCKNN